MHHAEQQLVLVKHDWSLWSLTGTSLKHWDLCLRVFSDAHGQLEDTVEMSKNEHQASCLSLDSFGAIPNGTSGVPNGIVSSIWWLLKSLCICLLFFFLSHYFTVSLLLPGVLCKQITITQIPLSGLALEETQTRTEPDTNSVVNVTEFSGPFASFIHYQVHILNLGLSSSDTCPERRTLGQWTYLERDSEKHLLRSRDVR